MTAATIGVVPSPLPVLRRAAAFLARTRSLLAPVAYDAILCLCLADFWLRFAGAVAMDIARLASAKDRAVAIAASKVFAFCDDQLFNAFFIGLMLLRKRLDKYEADEVKGPYPRRTEAAWKEVKCHTVMLGLYACVPFFLLMIVGVLMEVASEVMGSRREGIGSVLSDVGILGKDALVCFVIVPTAALKVWKVTRPGWGSGSGSTSVEKNP